MTDLTDSGAGFTKAAGETANAQYFVTILASITALSVLTFLYHLLNAPVFNTLSNAGCMMLIAYSGITVLRSPHTSTMNILYLAAACILTTLSIAFNWSQSSVTDGIKYLSIYIFYAAGHAYAAPLRSIETRYICFLAILPIAFLVAVGDSRVPDFVANNIGNTFSYFANANIATLYFSALVFALSDRLKGRAIFLQFLNAALMNKIGAAVATVVAVCLWILIPLRKESVIALTAFAAVSAIAFSLGAFDRAVTLLGSMSLLVELGPEVVSRMSFGKLVELTGTTDLSGFFRVIHWANIWDIYSSGGLATLLFGYGIGQTPYLTVLQFVPHNDYLRILAEYGPLNLIVFVGFLLHVLSNLKTGHAKVLFMILLIYFFSENLIDHFVSMTLYFTYAGRFSAMPVETEAETVR
ncbi:O-antigen ligase family protein [Bradyrhizobium sp. JYMT SZCCT0428]|uniref:O-antigen ligase family protein n=1 Tax=Bradyrhizobium sp. JYMT SZCCT0428 TaxID=2807673 RepID=UPI001BAC900A|nr:O-antigen ligase family protein [Bradyrhizobium sp. JYMT SZCCT0428]MBR1156040.1 O-antigen ligase family protein [Bradyrhizobium sp. JYMT SZCCT0428]